ncbi:MAG: TonB-dependent receptor plug domain-containing protein, partial [Ignavibacteriaceae bacterium]
KFTLKPFEGVKLDYVYILDNVNYRDISNNDMSFTFDPYGDFRKFTTGNTNILSLTHTLSSSTFYQASLSYFFKEFQQYVYKNPSDPRYTNTQLFNLTPTEVPSFKTGGTQNTMFRRTTGTYGFKVDMTSQVDRTNQVKTGVEYNLYNLTFNNVTLLQPNNLQDPTVSLNPFAPMHVPNPNDPNENLYIDLYTRRPTAFSAYIQDKIELKDLIINVGVRGDYFNPDGQLLNDPSDPDIYHPLKPSNVAQTMAQRQAHWYHKAPTSFQLSPRLGVAFPITDRGVVHFSFGEFFQIPDFQLLYVNPDYKFGSGTGNLGIAGNPGLKPEQTTSGEVGVSQALSDDITFDLTGYFRDISNLAGTTPNQIYLFGGAATYSQYANSDFGFVKGIILSVTKRMSDNWSATIDYTLQSAKGNESDPNAVRNDLVSGIQPEIQILPLNWDQTNTINATFNYASDAQWGFSLIGSYGSGFPYSPTQSQNVSSILINTGLKPSTINVDLRAYKDFMIDKMRLNLFLRVYNLFDTENQLNVYNDSGTANFTIAEYLDRINGNPTKLVNTLDQYFRNPSYYSEPRRVEIGASIFF